MKKFVYLLVIGGVFISGRLAAQTTDDSTKTFTLGEVVVTPKEKDLQQSVTAQQAKEFHRLTVSSALNLLPGINQSNVGPRNESMLYLRGFDLRQVPLLIDGVPVYVPYDGYVDLARFTTFNLSKIVVEKGGASVLYGPNTMGGAINLITTKPTHQLELNGGAGWLTGGHEEFINLGSRIKKFYVQADASWYKRDYYNLSKSFIPTKTEDGDKRDNSYNNDSRYGIKVGFTPNEKNELAIGYNHQDGSKGTPVYTGTDTLNSLYKSPRYWKWPKWNKESFYFLSNSTISNNSYFKTRLFYDRFINTLQSFDNATYTTQTRPYAFTSYYNDYDFGGNAEYGHSFSTKDLLKAAVHFKQDVHRENNAGEPVRKTTDNTYSVGVTYSHSFTDQFSLDLGSSFNYRQSVEAQNYNSTTHVISLFPSNNNSALNAQGKLTYAFNGLRNLVLSVDRMTRFATIKDRYSYKLGTAIPNPNLHAENALNYALQYTDKSIKNLTIEGSVFYNLLHDVIQNVNNVYYDTTLRAYQSQSQNKGRAAFYGLEAAFSYHFTNAISSGINYAFVKRKNLDNPTIYFTDVPQNKAIGWVRINTKPIGFLVNGEYDDARYSTSYGTKSPDFFLLHASAEINPVKWVHIQAGVNNIFDRNYSLTEGYPEQGRNYFVRLLFNYASHK